MLCDDFPPPNRTLPRGSNMPLLHSHCSKNIYPGSGSIGLGVLENILDFLFPRGKDSIEEESR